MSDLALICLGANVPDARRRLDDAAALLMRLGSIERSTPCYLTDPEYAGDVAPYLNRLIWLRTGIPCDELQAETKEYQTAVRAQAASAPAVAIDIDIVEWNGTVLLPADYSAAYFRKGLEMIAED